MPTQPKGEISNRALRLSGFDVSKAGVGEIDRRIGAKEIDTSTEGMMKRTKPDGSPCDRIHWEMMMPSVCTNIYADRSLPRWSLVVELLSQLSAVT